MTKEEIQRQREQAKLTPDETLVSELLIANHNIESVYAKMHELGRTDSLMELCDMFTTHYSIVHEEILRRMKHGNS